MNQLKKKLVLFIIKTNHKEVALFFTLNSSLLTAIVVDNEQELSKEQ